VRRTLILIGALLSLILVCGGIGACAWLLSGEPPTPTPTPAPAIMADCFFSTDVFAWVDTDGDGARDEGEPPLAGVQVNFSLTFYSGETTDAEGKAHVGGMYPSACDPTLENKLVARPPEGYVPTTEAAVPYTADRALYEFGFRPGGE
jgi:hypothetical protein